MITDALLLLDSSNASIRAANTYVGNNTHDLVANRDIGPGTELEIVTTVEVAFAGGTAVTIQVIVSAAAALTSPDVLQSSPAIPVASLTLGAQFYMSIPRRLLATTAPNAKRYLGVQYVSTGTFTLGTVSTRVVLDAPDRGYYASGFTSAV